MQFDVIVIGGGAAGLYCARAAGLRGRRVLLLEHNQRLGNKILISGGGRCNFTNSGASAVNYLTSGSLHFAKSALARCPPGDFVALVKRHGIAWHEKKLGQLFCDHSSREILQMLERECAAASVDVRVNCRVSRISRENWPAETSGTRTPDGKAESGNGQKMVPSVPSGDWLVSASLGEFSSHSLVIATGGLSFPKLGATSFGYEIARQFGVPVIPPRAGLVPLRFGPEELAAFGSLSGLSLDCETSVGAGEPQFRENLLFTHRGLSGPAILQISSFWRPGRTVRLDLLPGQSALELLTANRSGGRELRTILRSVLPERFVQAWCARYAPDRPLAQLSRGELEGLARRLHAWEFLPAGDEGFPRAEVTVGGVDTASLSSKTLECRQVPGLYFIGEVVDITGWLGGYNFQWAWASGQAAGRAA